MRLIASKLRAAAESANVTTEALVDAVFGADASSGLADGKGDRKRRAETEKAVKNWLAGRDHPRCRASQILAMAEACGVRAQDIARFTSSARFVRSTPQKTRLVVDMIRDRRVDDALDILEFSPRRAAVFVRKTLSAAIADAEAQGADVGELIVTEARADEGVIIKRFQPKDRGRAHPIQKKTSHITISVEERA